MSAVNRIAVHLDTFTPPVGPAERSRDWSDALFAAVAALQSQLSHPNAEVAREAAFAIIDLEKTRLRHDRELAGCAVCNPHTPCADHTPEPASDPLASASSEDKLALLDHLTTALDTLSAEDGDELDELDEEEEAVLAAAITKRLVEEQAAKPLRPSLVEMFQARLAAKEAAAPADSRRE